MSSSRNIVLAIIVAFIVGTLAGSWSTEIKAWAREKKIFSSSIKQSCQTNEQGCESQASSTQRSLRLDLPNDDQRTVDVVQRVLPSVVSITISKEVSVRDRERTFFLDPFSPFPFRTDPQSRNEKRERLDIGGGSGFFVSANGMIVTNKHVVADPDASYRVTTVDRKQYQAKVIARDSVLDLAILQIEGDHHPALTFGDSENLPIGMTVLAIGNALAEFQNSVTKGIVSGLNRRLVAGGAGEAELLEEAIQTDAAINPGNSGGPLIDLQGRVIGVNTAISHAAQSIGFALPSHVVKRVVESVQNTGRIVRPWLGVRYVMLNAELAKNEKVFVTQGALIPRQQNAESPSVVRGSPAEKAGLQEGDVIVMLNGLLLDDEHSLSSTVSRFRPGDIITVKIQRGKETREVRITLEERSARE